MTPNYSSSGDHSIVLDFLAISLGAVVGANSRYWITRYALRMLGPVFPFGTLAINVLGSFILGFFMVWTAERVVVDPRWRLLVAVGFCGGFTTFSGFAIESLTLIEQGQWLLVATNFLSNNFLAVGAAVAGMALARVL